MWFQWFDYKINLIVTRYTSESCKHMFYDLTTVWIKHLSINITVMILILNIIQNCVYSSFLEERVLDTSKCFNQASSYFIIYYVTGLSPMISIIFILANPIQFHFIYDMKILWEGERARVAHARPFLISYKQVGLKRCGKHI